MLVSTYFSLLLLALVCHKITYGEPITCDNSHSRHGSGARPTYVDMSVNVDEEMVLYPTPGGLPFSRSMLYNDSSLGFWASMSRYCMRAHAGTHIDAPFHVWFDGWKVDQFPVERFILPAVVVDVSSKTQNDKDYQLSVKDLKDWESVNGCIPEECLVIVNFGWEQHRPDPIKYLGTTTPEDPTTLHFPGFGSKAAKWLAKHRKIWAIGMDTPSIDYGQAFNALSFPAHIETFKRNVYAVEEMINVDKLPTKGATVYVAPLRITNGEASPVRAIGVY